MLVACLDADDFLDITNSSFVTEDSATYSKAEYLYVAAAGSGLSVDHENLVRAGINYRFGGNRDDPFPTRRRPPRERLGCVLTTTGRILSLLCGDVQHGS
jgi:hypothetical protein